MTNSNNYADNFLRATDSLAENLHPGECTIIDCRFELTDPEAGFTAYEEAHIPGAAYASLDRHLSGESTTDCGRHPMPAPAVIQENFARLGVSDDKPVVLYDDQGAMVAARAWWMLRYIGHSQVAILDGGWSAWNEAGLATEAGHKEPLAGQLSCNPNSASLVVYAGLNAQLHLVDARDPRRYRGEYEPIDARAGHIPGAQNHFFQQNLGESGLFRAVDDIRAGFAGSLGRLPDEQTVHYCGSGVSACHNIFAQMLAGLPEPKLYCGSWSEWAALTAEKEGSDERS